jgi:hypothetical protein
MRTPPPARLPCGGTPAERLDLAFRKVLTVSKTLLNAEEEEKRELERRRKPKVEQSAPH